MTNATQKRLDQLMQARDAGAPDATALADAAVLENWFFTRSLGSTGLCGEASGHPVLKPGLTITSPIISIDIEAGWARTFNTLYRLGTQLSHDDPRVAEHCQVIGASPDDGRKLPQRISSNREFLEREINMLSHKKASKPAVDSQRTEPEIIVNGRKLSEAEAMAVRVAVSSKIWEFHDSPDALGTDDHGRTMVRLYLQNLRSVERTMVPPQG